MTAVKAPTKPVLKAAEEEAPTPAPAPAQLRNLAFIDEAAAPVPVPFTPCPCPGTPHADGDTIYLRSELDLQGGFTFTSAWSDYNGDASGMPIEQALGMAYLVAGIAAWTFIDADAQPIPCTRAMITKLAWTPAVGEVASVAAKRYGVAALLPLVAGAQRSSRSGPTLVGHLTSRTKGSSPKRRKRS